MSNCSLKYFVFKLMLMSYMQALLLCCLFVLVISASQGLATLWVDLDLLYYIKKSTTFCCFACWISTFPLIDCKHSRTVTLKPWMSLKILSVSVCVSVCVWFYSFWQGVHLRIISVNVRCLKSLHILQASQISSFLSLMSSGFMYRTVELWRT